jgi:cytochrome oxidase assembly protein ShyY1
MKHRSKLIRRRPFSQRLVLVLIAFAIVLLALGGWAVEALRGSN